MSVLLRLALCLLHLTLSPTGPSDLGFVSAVLSISAGFSVSLYILKNNTCLSLILTKVPCTVIITCNILTMKILRIGTIQSYLVSIKSLNCKDRKVNVWQSMGPILFILYINGLCKVSEILEFVLFTDDTNLFASGSDLKQLCDAIKCSFTFLRMSSMNKTIFLHGWNLDQRILNETI